MTDVPDTREIADRYRRLAAAFTAKVDAVGPDQWDAPTPCEEWTVRALVGHVTDTQGMFLGFVGRKPEAEAPDDPAARWRQARDQMQAALDDPEVATAEYDGMFGRTTLAASVDGFGNFDLVAHGWDLARATGQDESIDPDDVARVRAAAERMGDRMRGPGAFGPAVEPPAGASDEERLMAFLGRQV